MNPKDVTMESVAGALGLRFDAMRHSLLLSKRNALMAGAKAIMFRATHCTSNDVRIACYGNVIVLRNMASEIDAEIEAMMKGKQ